MNEVLGQFGLRGGREVIEVRVVCGRSREIRQLWMRLDDADAAEADRIIARLRSLGAVTEV